MRGRDWLLVAACALMVLEAALLAVFVVLFAVETSAGVPDEFAARPKDRLVLETPKQVLQARTTGIGEFDFDGVHYVISEIPKEYVDYSSWYVRMP